VWLQQMNKNAAVKDVTPYRMVPTDISHEFTAPNSIQEWQLVHMCQTTGCHIPDDRDPDTTVRMSKYNEGQGKVDKKTETCER